MRDLTHHTDWSECRPGELRSVGEQLRAAEQRNQLFTTFRTAALTGLVVVLAVGTSLWLRPDSRLGGISCAECESHFDAYHAHLTTAAPLDSKLAKQMHAHLAECPMCRPAFEAEFPGVLSNALRDAGEQLARRPLATPLLAMRLLR